MGCFSTVGIMGALITALIVAGFAFANNGILFSPGKLNAQAGALLGGVTSHAEFADHCSLCHAPFWGTDTMNDRCVVCHADVDVQILVPIPLHGELYKSNPKLACRTCHPEHRGPEAPLTDLTNIQFPHTSFGFLLVAHQVKTDGSAFDCKDCHNQSYVPPFDQSVCITCHAQIGAATMQTHTADFGNNCLACHDGLDTYEHTFNHTGVPFTLTGKHVEVPCGQCHPNARTLADLKSAAQDCHSCHQKDDPHQGRLGADCGSCHTPAGWTPAKFDHNLAAFKLAGKHINVTCNACHINHVLQGTPTDCYACHQKDDTHKGRYGTDCSVCHSPDGWKPATVHHDLFTFKLTGRHITVDCASCHLNNDFKGTPTDCYSCHQKKDQHNGRFGRDCSACHTTDGWLPATFDHNLSPFPLTGAHTSLACTQCHKGGIFTGLSTACVACHALPATHAGMSAACTQCHSTSNWTANFNHPGGCGDQNCANHEGATCADCHPANYSTYTCLKCHDSNIPRD
jgi:hypothetical protein